MHVLVVGGGGEMGRCTIDSLVGDPTFERVTVADLDLAAATRTAEGAGEKAEALALDVSDADALAAALQGVDLVITTAGPFYRLGPPVLKAAMAAGVNYVDINDDWEPTLDMLELSDEVAAAGITAVIGMGSSPGISNMLAKVAVEQLDQVDTLYTGWLAGAGRPPAPGDAPSGAAFEHWLHQCSGTVRVWRDGRYQDVAPLEELTVDYPGLGPGTVWLCGHPEAVTLPRFRTEVRECLNVMLARPGLIQGVREVAAKIDAGEIDIPTAVAELRPNPGIRGPEAGERAPFPPMFAFAEGRGSDGKPVRVGVTSETFPDGGMGPMTGIPAAIVASMVARGEITAHGVLAPEDAVDPVVFMDELARRGGKENAGQPIVIARSDAQDSA